MTALWSGTSSRKPPCVGRQLPTTGICPVCLGRLPTPTPLAPQQVRRHLDGLAVAAPECAIHGRCRKVGGQAVEPDALSDGVVGVLEPRALRLLARVQDAARYLGRACWQGRPCMTVRARVVVSRACAERAPAPWRRAQHAGRSPRLLRLAKQRGPNNSRPARRIALDVSNLRARHTLLAFVTSDLPCCTVTSQVGRSGTPGLRGLRP